MVRIVNSQVTRLVKIPTIIVAKKTDIRLVENEEYMISYCNGENYVLHKVKYEEGKITIYLNAQKIIGIEDCEYNIKKIKKVILKDS